MRHQQSGTLGKDEGEAFEAIARQRRRNPWGGPNPRGRAGRAKRNVGGLGLFSARRAHQFLSNTPNWVSTIADYGSKVDLAPKNGAKFSLTPSCGTDMQAVLGPVPNLSGANVWLCAPKPGALPAKNPVPEPLGPGYMTAQGWYEPALPCFCPQECIDFVNGKCTCAKICPPKPGLGTPTKKTGLAAGGEAFAAKAKAILTSGGRGRG